MFDDLCVADSEASFPATTGSLSKFGGTGSVNQGSALMSCYREIMAFYPGKSLDAFQVSLEGVQDGELADKVGVADSTGYGPRPTKGLVHRLQLSNIYKI